MKIKDCNFWKFEAMMFLSAIITCITFQLIIALLSGIIRPVSYNLCWGVLICLPYLMGGIATWVYSNEDNNWIELVRKQIIFANVLLIIPTTLWSFIDNVNSPDCVIVMLYNLICAICSIPFILLFGYLYYHLTEGKFSPDKKKK
jgi:hypothetical protein